MDCCDSTWHDLPRHCFVDCWHRQIYVFWCVQTGISNVYYYSSSNPHLCWFGPQWASIIVICRKHVYEVVQSSLGGRMRAGVSHVKSEAVLIVPIAPSDKLYPPVISMIPSQLDLPEIIVASMWSFRCQGDEVEKKIHHILETMGLKARRILRHSGLVWEFLASLYDSSLEFLLYSCSWLAIHGKSSLL